MKEATVVHSAEDSHHILAREARRTDAPYFSTTVFRQSRDVATTLSPAPILFARALENEKSPSPSTRTCWSAEYTGLFCKSYICQVPVGRCTGCAERSRPVTRTLGFFFGVVQLVPSCKRPFGAFRSFPEFFFG